MTHTTTFPDRRVESFGSLKGSIAEVDIGSYPTNGEALTAGEFGLSQIVGIMPISTENGYVCIWDRANSKLKVMFFDYDAVADGAAIEFTNTGDAGTFLLLVLGR